MKKHEIEFEQEIVIKYLDSILENNSKQLLSEIAYHKKSMNN